MKTRHTRRAALVGVLALAGGMVAAPALADTPAGPVSYSARADLLDVAELGLEPGPLRASAFAAAGSEDQARKLVDWDDIADDHPYAGMAVTIDGQEVPLAREDLPMDARGWDTLVRIPLHRGLAVTPQWSAEASGQGAVAEAADDLKFGMGTYVNVGRVLDAYGYDLGGVEDVSVRVAASSRVVVQGGEAELFSGGQLMGASVVLDAAPLPSDHWGDTVSVIDDVVAIAGTGDWATAGEELVTTDLLEEVRAELDEAGVDESVVEDIADALAAVSVTGGHKDTTIDGGVETHAATGAVVTVFDDDTDASISLPLMRSSVAVDYGQPNTAPTIEAPDMLVHEGGDFDVMDGVTAADAEDGDLTEQAEHVAGGWDTTTPGTYELTYRVQDSAGAEATATRTLTVNARPTIAGEDMLVHEGEAFDVMDGMAADDLEDGDLTGALEHTGGHVDTHSPGVYELTYRVTDSHGATTEGTRTVTVNALPTITAPDLTITAGEALDVMQDVAADDLEDGDLTGSVEHVAGDLDTTTAGVYELTYRVTDSHGATTEGTRTVTVTPAPVDIPELPELGGPNMALLAIAGGLTGLGGAGVGLRRWVGTR